MAYSKNTYTADGSTTNFNITWSYMAQSEVKVKLDGVASTAFTFSGTSVIVMNTEPADGTIVTIYRETNRATRAVDFEDATTLTEENLDDANTQNFYIVQELLDDQSENLSQDYDGVWDANSKRIKNVTDPTSAQDASTKNYVDTRTINAPQIGDGTVSNDEFQRLDGVTSDIQTQLDAKAPSTNIDSANIANGTVSNTEFQYLNGVTSAIQTQLDGKAPSTIDSANIGDGTVSNEEFQRLDGVTSDIQTQLDAKAPSTGIDATKIADGSISNTEFQYLNGASSNIQTQFDSLVDPGFSVDETNTNTAKNKFVSNNLAKGWEDTKTAFDAGTQAVPLTMDEESTPSSPASNKHKLYFKDDGKLYKLDSSGSEAQVGGDSDAVVTNSADIFTTNVRMIEQHGTSAYTMEKGFTDELVQSNDMIDESTSSGYTYDATNDLYSNTLGASGQTTDFGFSDSSNWLEQEWTNTNQSTSQITVATSYGTATATITNEPSSPSSQDVRGDGGSDERIGQEFKVTDTNPIAKVGVQLKKTGSPTDNYFFALYASTTPTSAGGLPTGSALATTADTATSGLTTSLAEITKEFTSHYTPTANNYYFVVVQRDGSNDGSNCPLVGWKSGDTHADGQMITSSSSTYSAYGSGNDLWFKIYQTPATQTATISSGNFPANCDKGKIKLGSESYVDITERTSATQLALSSYPSNDDYDYTIRMTEFDSGKVQLNEAQVADSNLEMLLHFNDSYDDSSSNNFSAGSWTVDTSETSFDSSVKKYGSHSLKMISGDGSTVCWAKTGASQGMTDVMNSTTWTIEWWIYTNNYTFTSSNTGYLFGVAKPGTWYANGSGDVGIHFEYGSNGFYIIVDGLGRTEWHTGHGSGSMYPSADTWTHFAVTRDGTTVTVYKDGTQLAQKTDYASDWGNNASAVTELRFGHRKGDGSANHILFADANNNDDTGSTIYFDDMRFTTDVKYTGNFTAPASEHGTTTSVNVITEPVTTVPTFATLKDSSTWSDLNSVAITDTPYSGAHTITANADAKIKTSDSFTGSTDLTTLSSEGGSIASSDITINGGGSDKDYAFNDNQSEYANTGQFGVDDGGSAAWVGIELGSAKTIGKIKMHASSNSPTRIKNWKLYGDNSSTGVSGTVVATGTYADTKTLQEFTFTPNTTPYTHWTLEVLDNYSSGSNHITIAEVELYEGTSVSPKIGTGMAKFDGTGDFLSVPESADFTFGSGNFTIEAWVNLANHLGQDMGIVQLRREESAWNWALYYHDSGVFKWEMIPDGSSSATTLTSTTSLANATWYHLAIVRNSDTVTMYLNGSSEASTTWANTMRQDSGDELLCVGQKAGNIWHNGWMDEVRISKGIARYTGNFTPSTSAFTTDSDTSLLLHMDGSDDSTTFVDSSYDTFHYYCLVHCPSSVSDTAFKDENISFVIWTGSAWKKCIKYVASGTKFQRNTDTNATNAETWADCTGAGASDVNHAISEAIENNTTLRMKEADVEGISDADWNASGGWSTSVDKIGMAVTMKSASTSGNATTDLVQFNYDSNNSAMTIISKQWDGSTGRPSAPASAPAKMYLFVVDEQTTGTPSYYVSRDGSNWSSAITFDASWAFGGITGSGTTKTARRAVVDVSGLTSGTNPKLKLVSAQGNLTKLHAVGLQTRSG